MLGSVGPGAAAYAYRPCHADCGTGLTWMPGGQVRFVTCLALIFLVWQLWKLFLKKPKEV